MRIVLPSKLCKILLHTAKIGYENTYDSGEELLQTSYHQVIYYARIQQYISPSIISLAIVLQEQCRVLCKKCKNQVEMIVS